MFLGQKGEKWYYILEGSVYVLLPRDDIPKPKAKESTETKEEEK